MECFQSAYLILVFLVFNQISANNASNNLRTLCPRLYENTFRGYVPKGNISAGTYTEIEGTSRMKPCFLKCCAKDKCNIAFMSDYKCYHVSCYSNELCLPTLRLESDIRHNVMMILVKPVDENSWEDVLSIKEHHKEALDREIYNVLNDNRLSFQDAYQDAGLDESSYPYECNMGSDESCMDYEECVPHKMNLMIGTCECIQNYLRNVDGNCVKSVILNGPNAMKDLLSEKILEVTTNRSVPVTQKLLVITAESKEVKLPNDDVTLLAKVSPETNEGEKYQFEWTSLHQPDGSTAVKHQNSGQLNLSKLSEGLYTFKVSASTPTAYGETFVNVTVLPPSRNNKPPQIIITPSNQTIKLPNNAAVLDASSSTDDDGITSWHWELQQGPLGYQPHLADSSTLQLNDLTKPGNYSFKLTVTDTDKATSSSVANITVLTSTDYPPEANAGEDKIIYLPQNKITLNGSLSIDDHNITTWEWTKSPDEAQAAVDMQDTRTPYLKLANLEQGMYTFTLKVTDSAGQSSTALVHVFVKPPTNKPPVAEAGQNITTSLPQTWVVLDGSNSTDDNKIVAYKWEQVEGASTVVFDNANVSVTNVTGLTKGTYTFKLSVTDDNKNVANDLVYVIVNQNKNQKPIANAGPDLEVTLPANLVSVNGSNSKDDWAIVKWKWIRDDRSLALGNVAEKSDESPVLMIADIDVGRYVFNLTVFDEQGLSDSDSVVIVVKSDPKLYYHVDIVIDVNAYHLTEAQFNNLKGKLALLVPDGSKIIVRHIHREKGAGKAKITFYVETADGKPTEANEIVGYLRQKLRVDASLLGFTVAKLQTAICQNNCSGHGVCTEQTRRCQCEAFWMENMFKVYLRSDEDADCSWSILYVVLVVICAFASFVGVTWGLICLCCNLCTRTKNQPKPMNYKLISDSDDLPPFARKGTLSDSDTDSDVVFESRTKPGRFSEMRNGHKLTRNGLAKIGRRLKA